MADNVSKTDIRRILADNRIFSDGIDNLGNDADLTLDSLALVWLVHRIEEDHGISIDPDEMDAADFTSVNTIHALLARKR